MGSLRWDSSFQSALEKMNIAVEELTLLQQDAVPDDAEAIITTVRQRIFPQMMQQKSALIWLEAVKH